MREARERMVPRQVPGTEKAASPSARPRTRHRLDVDGNGDWGIICGDIRTRAANASKSRTGALSGFRLAAKVGLAERTEQRP